jgi:hypothetical protein
VRATGRGHRDLKAVAVETILNMEKKMNKMRYLVSGSMLAAVLFLAPSCSNNGGGNCDGGTCPDGSTTNPSGTCDATNCAGCCNGNTCVARTQQDNSRCGANGAACSPCSSGQSCTNGSCGSETCNATTCPAGCCSSDGQCLLGTSKASCGKGGAACAACAAAETCTNQACSGTGTAAKVGSACAADADCASIGTGYVCRKQTGNGAYPYPNGFCTKVCDGAQNACATGSTCLDFSGADGGDHLYGETNPICIPTCNPAAATSCRFDEGYFCLPLNAQGTVGGCLLNPQAPANQTNKPCTNDEPCSFPPTSGLCIAEAFPADPQPDGGHLLPDGGRRMEPTGWTGGSCTSLCAVSSPTQCNTDAICAPISAQDANLGACFQKCGPVNTGRANCRAGQICFGPVNQAGDGVCQPDCRQAGAGCQAGEVCNALGYCEAA